MDNLKQSISDGAAKAESLVENTISDGVSNTKTFLANSENVILNSVQNNSLSDNLNTNSGYTGSSIIKYGAIILILAFLGFNLFSYLGYATTTIADIFRPLVSFFTNITGDTVKQITNVAAVGTKATTDVAANSIDTGVSAIQTSVDKKSANINNNSNKPFPPESESDTESAPTIETTKQIKEKQILGAQKALNHSIKQLEKENNKKKKRPTPPESGNSIQTSGKPGYCFIGQDRGFRACAKVSDKALCMSGEIYPTMDVCQDPELRP